MALENRLDFFCLDKLIESVAPASPGSVEPEEDSLVVGGRRSAGLGEDFTGARSRRGPANNEAKAQPDR